MLLQKTPQSGIEKARRNCREDCLDGTEREVLMSGKFDDFLQGQLQDPGIRREYEALQAEHAVNQAMIDARQKSGMTQKELAERTGIAQADISKLEHGNANPSIRTLQRLAKGMGMVLKIEFAPEKAKASRMK